MSTGSFSLGTIADHLGVQLDGDARSRAIAGLNTLNDAGPDDLSYLGDAKYVSQLATTRAAAVLVSRKLGDDLSFRGELLLVDDASIAINRVLELMAPPIPRPAAGVDPMARVADSAVLGNNVAIGPTAVVGERVTIGHNTIIHAGVILADDVTIGEQCELFPNVVIRERCVIGHRVIIHANSVLGTDGFGYRFDGRQHVKAVHIGTVVIEDDVEIGSCTTIDRGKFAETRIGAGTKIDNQVQIAHNVRMGRLCILCANAGVAGSTIMGDGVMLGGGAGLKDHITVGSRTLVGGYSGVMTDVAAGTTMVGNPAVPQRQFMREQASVRKLPELIKELRALQQRVAELERRGNATA